MMQTKVVIDFKCKVQVTGTLECCWFIPKGCVIIMHYELYYYDYVPYRQVTKGISCSTLWKDLYEGTRGIVCIMVP